MTKTWTRFISLVDAIALFFSRLVVGTLLLVLAFWLLLAVLGALVALLSAALYQFSAALPPPLALWGWVL